MRIAKTFDDLPVGTPVEVEGHSKTWKGIVCKRGSCIYGFPTEEYIRILYTDGEETVYYEEELEEEEIMIVEIK